MPSFVIYEVVIERSFTMERRSAILQDTSEHMIAAFSEINMGTLSRLRLEQRVAHFLRFLLFHRLHLSFHLLPCHRSRRCHLFRLCRL